uniref:Uncharacterized protein n=1 Tax=Oryza rufipogon TaxID=4529 RepID=A0A0E0QP49_ORYRU
MKAKVVGGKGADGGRRLTLALGASANLWSQPAVPKETWGVAQGEEEDERNWWSEVLAATPCRTSPEVSTWDKKGCSRGGFSAPTKCYAVEPLCVPKPLALGSRFWALGDESSEDEVDREEHRSEEEVQGGSVLPEESFVKKAIDQGFTVDEILKAGEHLLCMSSPPKVSSCSMNSDFVGNRKLAKKMVEKVVNQKTTTCKPWKGPLPKARVSQPLTFGDVIGVALKKKKRASVASPARFTTVNGVNSPVAEENLDRANKSLSSMRLPVAHTCSIMEKAAAAPPAAAVRSSLDDNAKTLKFLMNLDKREKEGRIVLMSPGGQCTSDIEASKRSVELLSKGGSEHKFVSFGVRSNLVQFKCCQGLGRLLSHAGQHMWATEGATRQKRSDVTVGLRTTQLVQTSQTRERKQSVGEQSGGAQGERSRREVTMAWRGEGSGRSDGHGRERGDGFWEEEEEFFGARFDAGRLGFEPGYGFGQQGNHGWGQQRSGFRPRGSRSFGPRQGGFAGRPGRGGWENNRFSMKRFGERPLLKNEGRPGGGINKAGGGSKFAAKGEVGGGVSGGGGGASAGKGKVKVGDMEVVVNQMDGAAVVTDDPETNSELAILDCDPSLFENKEDKHDGDGRDGRVTKRAKNDDMLVDGKENGTTEGKYDAALNGNQCRHKMKESEISAIALGILDVAVGKVMNEVCDMVMEETEQPIEEEELPLDSNLGDEEKGEQEQEQEQEELTLVENNIEEAFKERVVRAANVKETVMTPKRSSARLGCNSGVHSVEKAWKNLELQQGNEVNSFLSFSNSSITSSLQNLGVLLGASSDEITDSVCSLKKTEVERINSSLSLVRDNLDKLDDGDSSEEEDDLNYLVLGHLCGDLMDEVMDEETSHLSCDSKTVLKAYKSKSRSKKRRIRIAGLNKKCLT